MPKCQECAMDSSVREYSLRYVCVIESDAGLVSAEDEFEIVGTSLAGKKVDPVYENDRRTLLNCMDRYRKESVTGEHPFYDEVNILFSEDFNSKKVYQ